MRLKERVRLRAMIEVRRICHRRGRGRRRRVLDVYVDVEVDADVVFSLIVLVGFRSCSCCHAMGVIWRWELWMLGIWLLLLQSRSRSRP